MKNCMVVGESFSYPLFGFMIGVKEAGSIEKECQFR